MAVEALPGQDSLEPRVVLEDDAEEVVDLAFHPAGGLPDPRDAGDGRFVGNSGAQAQPFRVIVAVHPIHDVEPAVFALAPVDRGEVDQELVVAIVFEETADLQDAIGRNRQRDISGVAIGCEDSARHLLVDRPCIRVIHCLLMGRRNRLLFPRVLRLGSLGGLLGRGFGLRGFDLGRLFFVAQRFLFGFRRLFFRGRRLFGRGGGFVVTHDPPQEARVRAMVSRSILRCSCIRP
jgi:hypothetical protein